MGTRTSIRFGAILDSLVGQRLGDYEQCIAETTNQSLIYAYRRPFLGHYHAFVLVQAARTFGRLTFEVAISRCRDYPYYRLEDEPRLGVSGFRQRMRTILEGRDRAEVYRSQDHLVGLLMELFGKSQAALETLADQAVPLIVEQYRTWQPLYADWLEAEKTAVRSEEARYPGLEGEPVAREVLGELLARGTFDRFLGPLKFRYREDAFFHCHLYLLARALEFLEPPDLVGTVGADEPDDELPPEQEPLPDAIAALSGRQSQPEAIELAVSTSVRTMQYAFLTSFAAVEAFFSEKPEQRLVELPPPEEEPSIDELYLGILDSPAYADAPYSPPRMDEPAPATPVTPTRPATRGRPDPFESVADHLQDDPFDALGSELGL